MNEKKIALTTTINSFTIKESYDLMKRFILDDSIRFIEITEVLTFYGEFTNKTEVSYRNRVVNKAYIIDLIEY